MAGRVAFVFGSDRPVAWSVVGDHDGHCPGPLGRGELALDEPPPLGVSAG